MTATTPSTAGRRARRMVASCVVVLLALLTWSGLGEAGSVSLAFDGMGQRIADARAAYAWTWGGQLAEVATTTGGTKAAGPRVAYRYDALGRLLKRSLVTADGDFVEAQVYVWNGDELLRQDGVNHLGEHLWRVDHLPGPVGLDDSPQLRVASHLHPADPAPEATRLFSLVRDELGSVVAVVEHPASSEPQLKARVLYAPYGEAFLEEGPTLLAADHDLGLTTAGGATQSPVEFADLDLDGDEDDPTGVPGGLVYAFTCELDPATLEDGVLFERLVENEWTPAPGEVVVVLDQLDPTQLLLMPRDPCQHGERYRVTLTASLRDPFGRRAVYPDEAATYLTEITVDDLLPEEPVQLAGFPVEYPLAFDTVKAASARLDCGAGSDGPEPCFPGGLSLLFQGLWHDPTTGIAYARARWYDSRTASWLSPDPMGAFDSENQYAFVAGAPNMYADPQGEYIESGWDVASLAAGTASILYNAEQGNVGAFAWDLFGIAVDTAAVLTPLPGGVGTGTRLLRAAQRIDQIGNVVQASMAARESFAAGGAQGYGWGAFNLGMATLGVRHLAMAPQTLRFGSSANMGPGDVRWADEAADVVGDAPGKGLRIPENLETTAGVRAETWQGYEKAVRDLYGDTPYVQRQYQSILNGEVVNGVADNIISGSRIAVEAKFVRGGNWASSLRNPRSAIGRFGFSKAERIKMIMQARKYSGAFDEVIYHSNSLEFIAHYSRVFRRMGITNARWVHTPIVR